MRWRGFPLAIVSCQRVGNSMASDDQNNSAHHAHNWSRMSHGVPAKRTRGTILDQLAIALLGRSVHGWPAEAKRQDSKSCHSGHPASNQSAFMTAVWLHQRDAQQARRRAAPFRRNARFVVLTGCAVALSVSVADAICGRSGPRHTGSETRVNLLKILADAAQVG